MANNQAVVAVGVELAPGLVGNRYISQLDARLQLERFNSSEFLIIHETQVFIRLTRDMIENYT